MLASGLMVVVSRNPVYSVVVPDPCVFQCRRAVCADWRGILAMLLVVVYVGAVAVLFLFVVMMLDINFSEMRAGFQKYLPLGWPLLSGAFWLFELVAAMYGDAVQRRHAAQGDGYLQHAGAGQCHLHQIHVSVPGCGSDLLVAMIGAISLTMRKREGVRRQNISTEIA